jgi:hypothetical protein
MRNVGSLSRATLIVSVLLALACVRPPAPPAPRPDTQVNAPFSRVWEAVVDRFARSNIPVKTIDRASGLIAAESVLMAGDLSNFGGCNFMGMENRSPVGATFNVLVRGDSTRSSIVVTADWIGVDHRGNRIGCVTTGKWEQGFEAAIKTQAEVR